MTECIGCGTKIRISRHLFGTWICDKCLLKRTIRLYEKFIERKIWNQTGEKEEDYRKTLNSLKNQLGDNRNAKTKCPR